jgi:hypothetical protein
MKRTLVIASVIGLFMVSALDLQAHHRRNGLPQLVRGGIAIALIGRIGAHYNLHHYARYDHRQDRQVAKEIRKNEKRIWKLEKRINKLERHHDNYGKIRRLEEEINWLQRRNDYLRSRRY